jgi:hypothetical protein
LIVGVGIVSAAGGGATAAHGGITGGRVLHPSQTPGVPKSARPSSNPSVPDAVSHKSPLRIIVAFISPLVPAGGSPASPTRSSSFPAASFSTMLSDELERETAVVTN